MNHAHPKENSDMKGRAMKVTNGNAAADALLHSHYENGWKL